jgi:WASH complex subunit FAM21
VTLLLLCSMLPYIGNQFILMLFTLFALVNCEYWFLLFATQDSVSSDDLFGVGASPGSSTLSSDESDESASERQDDDGGDDDEEGKLKAASGHDFAAELAARIGAAVPKSAKESDDEAKHSDEDDDWKDEAEEENDAKTAPRKDKQKKKKKKKEKAKEEERKRKESGGLFDESGDDGLGGEAFEKDGLFSTKGGGLFDGSDEDEGSLFDDKPKKAPEPANAEPSLSTKKKPPPGAVPMFGGNLFGGADEDEEAVEEAPVPVVNKASTPAAKKTVGEGLFSSEGEENDDLFSTIAKPTVVDDQPKKATGLFDADDDNLFDKNEPNKPEGKQARKTKKPPVGGVSLFGGMMSPEGDEEDDLFSTIPSQSAAATSKSPGSKPTTAASGGLTSSLFDDDDEDDTQDDIFAIKSNTVEKGTLVKGTQPQESTAAKKKPVGGVSLFGGADLFGKSTEDIKPKAEKQAESEKPKASPAIDIEEDNEADLFSAQPKPAKQTAQPASTSTEKGGGGLFDDDDDDEENDLFAIKRAPQKEPPKEVKEVKKKPVGGVSLFGGKDLFGAEDKHPKAKVEEKKAVDKGPLLGNDDEDNDLFSSSKPTPKLAEKTVDRGPLGGSQSDHDLFGDSLKPKSRAQEQKPSQKGPLGLDDDDDDLFASPPSAKLKVEEKPKPTERGPLDFEDEDDDDLFSAFPSKPKDQPAASRPEAPSVTSKSSKPAEKIQASPKPAPTAATKATGGGLFGDDDDDDDDLFAPKKPSPQPAQNSPQPQKKKPVGGVSLFGGTDLFAKAKEPTLAETGHKERVEKVGADQNRKSEPKTAQKTGGGLFDDDDDDDDDLFAPAKPMPSTNTTSSSQSRSKKPVGGVSLFGGANLFDQPEQKEEAPKTKEEPKKPKGLFDSSKIDEDLFKSEPAPSVKSPVRGKMGLAINPMALLPGARPPIKQVEEKSVSFDEPVEVNTLETLTKGRSRGQARRPPSRRHRQGSSTSNEALTPKSPMASSFPSSPVTTSAEDDLFGVPSTTKKSSASAEGDLFGMPSTTKKSSASADDDLFGIPPTVATTKSPTPAEDSIFDLSLHLEPNKPNQDDDIFVTKTTSRVKSKGPVTTVNKEDLDAPVAAAVTAPEEDLFADIEKATKKPVKFSGPSDAELFGDTGDIFADVPSKPKAVTKKTTKKKKVQKETSPAVPEGSIFDEDPVPVKPKKKVVKKTGNAKKSTKQKAASIFDDDAPSIFDDPSAGAK